MTAQDKELFSQLYDRNYKRLLYAAIRIAHNPFTAEELTNEAFTILLTHFDRVRQHPNLPGWLHTVLTNLALDEYKRQSRYVQVPLDSVQNLGCEPASLSMLDLLPNELSRTDKEILYLRYQLNLNCVDIAEYLHISVDTVKTHRRSIYRKLDIHSHQELLTLLEDARATLGDDASPRIADAAPTLLA